MVCGVNLGHICVTLESMNGLAVVFMTRRSEAHVLGDNDFGASPAIPAFSVFLPWAAHVQIGCQFLRTTRVADILGLGNRAQPSMLRSAMSSSRSLRASWRSKGPSK